MKQSNTNVINLLSNFYDEIKNNFLQEYETYLSNKKRKQLRNLDFSKKIILTEKSTNDNKIINYNLETNNYEISLLSYNKALDKQIKPLFSVLEMNDVLEKYKDMANNSFSDLEVEILISSKQLNIEDIIKSQFLHELFSSIIDIRVSEEIKFKDTYGIYFKKSGSYLNEGIIEYFSRKFSSKNNINYIPETKYQKILNLISKVANNKNFEEECFNGNIHTISNNLNLFFVRKINDLEIEYFEEEFKIKKGSIVEEKYIKLSQKEEIASGKELLVSLREIKERLENNSNAIIRSSQNNQNVFGFVNMIQLMMIIIFILIILIIIYLVVR